MMRYVCRSSVSKAWMKLSAAGGLILACGLALPAGARAQKTDRHAAAASSDQFFIIASVDVRQKQLVLKRPTEVTELMRVSDKTVYTDEDGKPIHFGDLRAGDTVFVAAGRGEGGTEAALRIRKGPMTVEELRRRYLNLTSTP